MNRSLYKVAREIYAEWGVDTETVFAKMEAVPVSIHCWQGDDVAGFEDSGQALSGGIQATGNYPGKARTIDELRSDFEKALSLIPGKHRMNLHAIYGDFGGKKIDRDAIETKHFQSWIDWCKGLGIGMDFNPSFFSHELSSSGFTLASADDAIRKFWIEHGKRCRAIGADMGRQLGSPCVTNVWIPDGFKDLPIDRKAPRHRLEASLDAIFAEKLDPAHNLDAVESKLFGIGSESFVVGSHEFYMGYAVTRETLLCLDAGHFHPTETLADKISSVLQFVPEIILHVSRGVRWDSDHVVLFDDPTRAVLEEVVRGDFLGRTHVGLDYFDASINRVLAWVLGTRNVLKCLLMALLEPADQLRKLELEGDYSGRLALLEELKTLPFAAVWDEYCDRKGVPTGRDWVVAVREYEALVLSQRN